MPWLKFRHKFAHGKGSWEWRDLGDDEPTVGEIESVVEDLQAIYEDGDKYRGLDHVIPAVVPRWVIEDTLRANAEQFVELEAQARRLDEQIKSAIDCLACTGRQTLIPDGTGRVDDCPDCGRANTHHTPYAFPRVRGQPAAIPRTMGTCTGCQKPVHLFQHHGQTICETHYGSKATGELCSGTHKPPAESALRTTSGV